MAFSRCSSPDEQQLKAVVTVPIEQYWATRRNPFPAWLWLPTAILALRLLVTHIIKVKAKRKTIPGNHNGEWVLDPSQIFAFNRKAVFFPFLGEHNLTELSGTSVGILSRQSSAQTDFNLLPSFVTARPERNIVLDGNRKSVVSNR